MATEPTGVADQRADMTIRCARAVDETIDTSEVWAFISVGRMIGLLHHDYVLRHPYWVIWHPPLPDGFGVAPTLPLAEAGIEG